MPRRKVMVVGLSLLPLLACGGKEALSPSPTGGGGGASAETGDTEGLRAGTGGAGGTGSGTANPPATVPTPTCEGLLEMFGTASENVCSVESREATFTKINVLIVLDKSSSMSVFPEGFTKSKWAGAGDSLEAILKPTETLIDYGLMVFPHSASEGETSCELGSVNDALDVPLGAAAETVPLINDLIATISPGGATPTANALKAALEYYTSGQGHGLAGRKYVLLVTDGGANCNPNLACDTGTCTDFLDRLPSRVQCWNGDVANCCEPSSKTSSGLPPQALCLDDVAVTAQLDALRAAEIHTFVIGIAGSDAQATVLDRFAEAGGEPAVDRLRKHYEVTGEVGLMEAFISITTSLVHDCTVRLVQAPLYADYINVAIDCVPVPREAAGLTNWVYDESAQSIVIQGSHCDRIEAVGVRRIDVIAGCPRIYL